MKIYVVTKGDYSDYHICCATIDKEQAERAVKFYSDEWDQAYIEEFDSNDILKIPDGTKKYTITFCCSSSHCAITHIFEDKREVIINNSPIVHYNTVLDEYIVDVNAIDQLHAIKIASDALAKYRAEEEGL